MGVGGQRHAPAALLFSNATRFDRKRSSGVLLQNLKNQGKMLLLERSLKVLQCTVCPQSTFGVLENCGAQTN
jgi:hypothetical protein